MNIKEYNKLNHASRCPEVGCGGLTIQACMIINVSRRYMCDAPLSLPGTKGRTQGDSGRHL